MSGAMDATTVHALWQTENAIVGQDTVCMYTKACFCITHKIIQMYIYKWNLPFLKPCHVFPSGPL